MSQECLMSGCQRKFSMENCKKESAHKVAKRNATKTPLKPRLRISIFQYIQLSWEQAARDRTKWHCLIKKGASQFEAKKICEAEWKRKERKARAKGPSSDSSQSEFTFSISHRIGGNLERRVVNNFSFSIAKINVFDCFGTRKRFIWQSLTIF